LLALIWGYNWVVMKIGLRYVQPFTFASLRNLLSAVGLFVILAAMRKPLRPKAFGLTVLVGLLQTTGFVGLTFWALETGGTGKIAVLTYTMPFWLLLMAWVVLGERLRGFQWLAVGVAFAGLFLILAPWQLPRRSRQPAGRRRRLLVGGQRRGRQGTQQAAYGRPLVAHRLADAPRLAAPAGDRRAHLYAGTGVDWRRSSGRSPTT